MTFVGYLLGFFTRNFGATMWRVSTVVVYLLSTVSWCVMLVNVESFSVVVYLLSTVSWCVMLLVNVESFYRCGLPLVYGGSVLECVFVVCLVFVLYCFLLDVFLLYNFLLLPGEF